jgi:hypothetical protein
LDFSADASRMLIRDVRFGTTAGAEAEFGVPYTREVFVTSATTSTASSVLLPPDDLDLRYEYAHMVPNIGGIIITLREATGGRFKTFKTDLDGSGMLDLTQNLPLGEQSAIGDVSFFPDGSAAILRGNGEATNRQNLYRVDLSTAAVDTFFPLVTDHAVFFTDFGALNDGVSAWVLADLEVDGQRDLYLSAPGFPPLFGPNLLVARPVIGEIASNSSLAFGNQVVDGTSSRSLILQNTGNDPLENIALSITGGHAGEYASAGVPTEIAAGESATVTTLFTPQQAWVTSASLAIVSNDADSPHIIHLTGTGVNDGDNDPGSDTWETANGFDPNVDGDVATLDTDADGDPDILEIFQGTDRNGAGEKFGFKQTQADAGSQTLSTQFRRSTLSSATSVVTAVGRWSPDLQNWYYSGETVNGVTVTFEENPTDMGDYEIVNVTASVTEGNTPQLYYTLEMIPVE